MRGSQPFFARRELRVLLDYVRFALTLERPLTREGEDQLLAIANTPSRKLRRDVLRAAMRAGRIGGLSAIAALTALVDGHGSTLSKWQGGQVNELLDFLERLRARLDGEPRLGAGELLYWLVGSLGYLAHFDDYYGRGESAVERKFAVRRFVDYARATGLAPRDFLDHIDRLDPTQDAPPERQLTLTTIFRTKGLEYDYVILPQCDEGYVPCLYSAGEGVFDTAGRVREPEPSEAIENERRLFYVGVTRARKCVFIGASGGPPPAGTSDTAVRGGRASRFLEEIELESVRGIMEPYQHFLRGDPAARPRLLDSLTRLAGVRWVREHFVGHYLATADDGDGTFTGRVAGALAAAPEAPFVYRHAYPVKPGASPVPGGGTTNADVPF